ncbi:MAG: VOC family protein [Pseudomonadota bacterium]|jgi:catechol 2,3-dioxygenase-like lactoylglutathione lyase family enzyme
MHEDKKLPIALDHCVIASSDVERSDAFYRMVFGAAIEAPMANFRQYRIGDVMLSVHGPGLAAMAPPELLATLPVQPGGSDLCFRWTGTAAALDQHLRDCGIEIIFGPIERTAALGAGTSRYFRDPDGSLLEFILYDRTS